MHSYSNKIIIHFKKALPNLKKSYNKIFDIIFNCTNKTAFVTKKENIF